MSMTENRNLGRAALVVAGLLLLAGAAPVQAGTTERVSVSSRGTQGNDISGHEPVAISEDGRFVAFKSQATNLVPNDTDTSWDVLIHDRLKGSTELVSVGLDGIAAGSSIHPTLSAHGRFVAFWSSSDNLVPGDTNGHSDVFVRDRLKGTTERVSISSDGAQGNDESGSDFYPGVAISAQGRFVAFCSDATNLVLGDTNNVKDIFVRDRLKGTTERVSVASGGRQVGQESHLSAASISADGRFVAFTSAAGNLVPG